MVHHCPLILVLIHRVNFKANADNMIRYGVMQSCFTVGGFINFWRVVYVSIGVKHVDYFVHGKFFLVLTEERLLSAQDKVLYLFFILFLVLFER